MMVLLYKKRTRGAPRLTVLNMNRQRTRTGVAYRSGTPIETSTERCSFCSTQGMTCGFRGVRSSLNRQRLRALIRQGSKSVGSAGFPKSPRSRSEMLTPSRPARRLIFLPDHKGGDG